jgi:hypothetical protein
MMNEIKQSAITAGVRNLSTMKSLFPSMPDSLQDAVYYACQWKESFSDMHPNQQII